MSPKHPRLGLIVLLVLCFGVAAIGGLVTSPNIPNWYPGLAKPPWTPPGWIFGPVWSVLYLSMAVAAWFVWRKDGLGKSALPMTFFAIQLALNAAWSWLFFGLHNPGAAFVDIIMLWGTIFLTMVAFWLRSSVAGMLFVPYLAWVSYASILNFAIWRLNT